MVTHFNKASTLDIQNTGTLSWGCFTLLSSLKVRVGTKTRKNILRRREQWSRAQESGPHFFYKGSVVPFRSLGFLKGESLQSLNTVGRFLQYYGCRLGMGYWSFSSYTLVQWCRPGFRIRKRILIQKGTMVAEKRKKHENFHDPFWRAEYFPKGMIASFSHESEYEEKSKRISKLVIKKP